MQVSFRIDAASYGSFVSYTEVLVRNEDRSGSVVVSCHVDEVGFKAYRDPKTGVEDGRAWIVQRKRPKA